MNTLKLRVINGSSTETVFKIDGKEVIPKRGKNGASEITYQTDKSSVKLSVQTYLDLRVKGWFLRSLFFFLISVFGIFDKRGNGKSRALSYEGEIPVTGETKATVRVLRFRENEKGLAIDGVESAETENRWYVDGVVKKRGKVVVVAKILAAAVTAVVVALLVI